MYYILDYIDYYKETDLEKTDWNVMDNLICAILVYLPIEGFKGRKKLARFTEYAKKYEKKDPPGNMIPLAYKVLNKIEGSARYKEMVISNFKNDRSNQAQFGAMTVRIGRKTVIVYKGTDHSIIGWMENFRVAYDYPTYTQDLAIEYMKKNIIPFLDREIYVTGHSKGGNLAMVAAMEMEGRCFKNIKKIYNFDGPGLRKAEFDGEKYKNLEEKLVNIVPKGSIVGMLLHNQNYTVVESASTAINDHHPDTWRVFGEYFVPGELSKLSLKLHESAIVGVEKFSYSQAEKAFETLFKGIEKEYTSDLDFSPEVLFNIIKNMKDVDPEIARSMYEIMKTLL